jgi:hypothetical protein
MRKFIPIGIAVLMFCGVFMISQNVFADDQGKSDQYIARATAENVFVHKNKAFKKYGNDEEIVYSDQDFRSIEEKLLRELPYELRLQAMNISANERIGWMIDRLVERKAGYVERMLCKNENFRTKYRNATPDQRPVMLKRGLQRRFGTQAGKETEKRDMRNNDQNRTVRVYKDNQGDQIRMEVIVEEEGSEGMRPEMWMQQFDPNNRMRMEQMGDKPCMMGMGQMMPMQQGCQGNCGQQGGQGNCMNMEKMSADPGMIGMCSKMKMQQGCQGNCDQKDCQGNCDQQGNKGNCKNMGKMGEKPGMMGMCPMMQMRQGDQKRPMNMDGMGCMKGMMGMGKMMPMQQDCQGNCDQKDCQGNCKNMEKMGEKPGMMGMSPMMQMRQGCQGNCMQQGDQDNRMNMNRDNGCNCEMCKKHMDGGMWDQKLSSPPKMRQNDRQWEGQQRFQMFRPDQPQQMPHLQFMPYPAPGEMMPPPPPPMFGPDGPGMNHGYGQGPEMQNQLTFMDSQHYQKVMQFMMENPQVVLEMIRVMPPELKAMLREMLNEDQPRMMDRDKMQKMEKRDANKEQKERKVNKKRSKTHKPKMKDHKNKDMNKDKK